MHEFWAYISGWQAWFAGARAADCPYGLHGQQAGAWLDGWIAASAYEEVSDA